MDMVRRIKGHLSHPVRYKRHRAFLENPRSPWLISFPRTGSHWLRMILESYTRRPLQPVSFFEHESDDYLLRHEHDYEFKQWPGRLIYLYRDPVPTVYSQIRFHDADPFDAHFVELWSTFYRLHLTHFAVRPHDDRILVTYESMKDDLVEAVAPVLRFLDVSIDEAGLRKVAAETDKRKVDSRTKDPRVISKRSDYDHSRQRFADEMGELVRAIVMRDEPMRDLFAHLDHSRKAA